jgi:cysteine desulfurase/selenocysteine lyase
MDLEKVRQDFPALGRTIKGKPIIYLDSACMSLKSRPVIDALVEYYEQYPACAGRSIHSLSSMVEEKVRDARKEVASFLGARDKEIVFTRNTTEAINLVAYSLGLCKNDVVVTSDREHNSNLIPWHVMRERQGIVHRVVKSNDDGTFSLESLREEAKGARLVSVVHSSNLDGYTLPVEEIIKVSHDEGALVMLDAAQSAPHNPFSFKKLGADFLACSGHKLTGPTGTGALCAKESLLEEMQPFMTGGETVRTSTYDGHELLGPPEKFEAGLQDYAGLIGFGAAARYIGRIGKESIQKHEARLNAVMTEGVRDIPGISILGPPEPDERPGILSFNLEGMDFHQIAMLLSSNANIMIRSGHHCCSSWFNAHGLRGSARASLYLYNTEEEAEAFAEELKKIAKLR